MTLLWFPRFHVLLHARPLDVQLSDIEAVRARLSSESARFLTLTQMDDLWCQHLQNMNLLKESVSMEVYQGRNPLEEFAAQVSEPCAVSPLPSGVNDSRSMTTWWLAAYIWCSCFVCLFGVAVPL